MSQDRKVQSDSPGDNKLADIAQHLASFSASFESISQTELDAFIAGQLEPESSAYNKVIAALANDTGLRERWQTRLDSGVQHVAEQLASFSAPFEPISEAELEAFVAGQLQPDTAAYNRVIAALANDAGLRERWQTRVQTPSVAKGDQAAGKSGAGNVVSLFVRAEQSGTRPSVQILGPDATPVSGAPNKASQRSRRFWRPAWAIAAGLAGVTLMTSLVLRQPTPGVEAIHDPLGLGIGRSNGGQDGQLALQQVNFSGLLLKSLTDDHLALPPSLSRPISPVPADKELAPLVLGASLIASELAKADPTWQMLAKTLQLRAPSVPCVDDCVLKTAIGAWALTMHAHCQAGSPPDTLAKLKIVSDRINGLMASRPQDQPTAMNGDCSSAARIWGSIAGITETKP